MAVVTGGAQGIGFGVAQRIVAGGGSVALWDRDGKMLDDAGARFGDSARVLLQRVDVGDLGAVEAAAQAAVDHFGGIDILINNAGIGRSGRDGTLKAGTEDLFDELYAVNVKGPHFVTQAALPRLRDGGRIVNIGSMSGKVGQPFAAGYAMTKRAIQSLTFSTALAVAKRQITCNCIAPGAVATEFITALREQPGWDEATAKHTPMGRLGEPEDIAGAVMMLLGDDARWVTGQVIEASGGLSL